MAPKHRKALCRRSILNHTERHGNPIAPGNLTPQLEEVTPVTEGEPPGSCKYTCICLRIAGHPGNPLGSQEIQSSVIHGILQNGIQLQKARKQGMRCTIPLQKGRQFFHDLPPYPCSECRHFMPRIAPGAPLKIESNGRSGGKIPGVLPHNYLCRSPRRDTPQRGKAPEDHRITGTIPREEHRQAPGARRRAAKHIPRCIPRKTPVYLICRERLNVHTPEYQRCTALTTPQGVRTMPP